MVRGEFQVSCVSQTVLMQISGYERTYVARPAESAAMLTQDIVHYRKVLRPLSCDRESIQQDAHANAMNLWRLAAEAVRHAVSDDTSDTGGEDGMSPEELRDYKADRAQAKRKLIESSKMMDLQYWLEMVDTKHRYGANLKAYHLEWQKSDTHENFFFWLDHGQGKHIEVPSISRERLESMQVRYLSREERHQYLVRVDSQGRLCWAKNGERITTSTKFRDSIDGVVPLDSEAPAWSSPSKHGRPGTGNSWSTSSTSSVGSASRSDSELGASPQLKRAKGLKRLKQVSPAVVLNKLLLKAARPNTWIFVADTSFHLYVGIKQSGTFQHSSFLQGARISSAGLIQIQDGQLRKLSPLSGHYRTPTKNFRFFLNSLKDAAVDTSKLSISRSYAVLLGVETYNRSRKALRNGMSHILHPGKKAPELEPKVKLPASAGKATLTREANDDCAALPYRSKPTEQTDSTRPALQTQPEIVLSDILGSSAPLPDITEEIPTGLVVDTSQPIHSNATLADAHNQI
jgi:hypothetical protein